MRKTTLKSLLIIALAIIPMTFFGQEEKNPYNYWYVGIEGGVTELFGDNGKNYKFDGKELGWNANIFAGYTFKNQVYLYGDFGYGQLGASSKNWYNVKYCDYLRLDINIGYDIMQLFKFKADRLLAIVPHVGYGIMQPRTKTEFKDGSVVKTGYPGKGGNKGGGIDGRRNVYENPFGVNFIFNFSEKFAANLDFVALREDTDGLENVNHGKHGDWVGTINVGVAYKFGRKEFKPCPICPECEEPAADYCDEAIRQAVEDALKNNPCPEESKAEDAKSAVPFKSIDMDLTFKVGSAKVEDNEANRNEIEEINEDINNGMQFSAIKVEGYASPEGNDAQNQKLSEDRANATVEYIQENLGDQLKDIELQAEGMGSDWEGFFTALRNSNISNKAEIEKSIKEAENPTAKLNQLKKQNPALEELLNNLRRTRVSYIE